MSLNKISIRVAPLTNTIVLARFGKDKSLALETRDAMNDFLQALTQYVFEGVMPEKGEAVKINYGGGDEQFTLTVKRND